MESQDYPINLKRARRMEGEELARNTKASYINKLRERGGTNLAENSFMRDTKKTDKMEVNRT